MPERESMRTIVDEEGVTWTVWAVSPRVPALGTAERRRAVDRRLEPAPDPIVERRDRPERRTTTRPPPTAVAADFVNGWLAVQRGEVRRRVAPIPPAWESLTDEALLALLRSA
jgi:hypothetical protein